MKKRRLAEVDRKPMPLPKLPTPPPAPDADDDGAWCSAWCEENGSAVDVWGGPELRAKLKALLDGGAQVKAFMFSTDDEGSLLTQARVKERALAPLGWKKLAYEDNIDQAELLMYRVRPAQRRPRGARTQFGQQPTESRAATLVNQLLGHA